MAVSYNSFISKKYHDSPALKKHYGSLQKYKAHYINNKGFSDWLETLRGQSISQGLTINIAKMFVIHDKRSPGTISNVLSSISRQYNTTLPAISGILTPQYWETKISKYNWTEQQILCNSEKGITQ